MATAATIKTLMRHAIRWSVAAEQDENPLIRILHANYGMAYILALRDVAGDSEVRRVTGQDPREIQQEITKLQDWAVRSFAPHVPGMIPKTPLARLMDKK